MTLDNPHHVVFIDSRVPDLQDLLDGLQPGETAFVIDQATDGLQQIADILAANNLTGLSTISIVSHGTTGEFVLGSSLITDGTLVDHAAALAAIGAALGSGGAIQLYGCDVAKGEAGQTFIDDFSTLAGGVQVDAATHIVGSASLGGSWLLDAMSAAPGGGAAAANGGASAVDASSNSDDTARPDPSPSPVSPFNSDGLPTTPAATGSQSTSSAAATTTSSPAVAQTTPFTAAALDNFQGQLVTPLTAQLFFRINQSNDVQLGAINNIGSTATPTSIYFGGGFHAGKPQNVGIHNGNEQSIAVDTAAGLVFSVGQGNNGSYDAVSVINLKTGALIQTVEFGPNTGDANNDDIVMALWLDPFTNTLYVGDWGTALTSTGIAKFSYDVTGNLTASTGGQGSTSITKTQPNGTSVTSTAAGVYLFDASHVSQFTDANAMFFDTANHKFYYTNDDFGYNISPFAPTNAVYVTDTTTNTTTQLSSLVQFPAANQSLSGHDHNIGHNGSVVGLAVDVAHNIVFFETTDDIGSANNALWWVNTTGANQTATKITLPAGVTLGFAGQITAGGNTAGLTFDASTQQLWLTNAQNDVTIRDLGAIYQLSWNSVSHTVSLVNTYDTAQLVGATPSTVDSVSAPSTTFLDILPTLVTSGTASAATEQSASVTLLSATPTVTDPDGNHLAGGSVKITGGTFVSNESSAADDHLSIAGASSGTVGGTSISFSYSSATETLTLSGYDTLAHYQTALAAVQYNTTGDNPTNYGSNTTRAITWQADDGAVGNPSGANNVTTTTLTVVGVNDAPTLSGTATASFTENGGAKTLSSLAAVADPDSLTFANATVKIVGGTFAGDGDVLAATTAGTTITASYNSATETLVLSGSDTQAHYQSVLDSVTFNTNVDNPTNYGSNTTRTVTWQLNDGSGSFNLSTVVTSTLNITAVNDPPTLTATNGTVAFTEGQVVTLSPSVTVADPDNLTLASATVKVAGGTFAGDGDVLATSTIGTSITASYNSATETLTLTGSDTLAHYQGVLDKVTFASGSNPTDYGSLPTRTLTWVLNDGAGSFNLSTAQTTTVSITAINDPPALVSVAPTATYVENAAAVTLSGAATVADVDSLTLANATVKIVGGTFAGDGDVLATDTTGTTITASYNSATETLTLTGSDTLAHYQTVLDKVTFSTPNDNPTNLGANPTRTVTWLLNDGSGSNNLSSLTTTTISLTAVNDAPTLSLGTTTTSFTENGASIVLSPTVSVVDPDNPTWTGATVKIAGGTFVGDGDVLAADTTGTAITASYDSATETLILSGTDTPADYQHVLQSVTFVTGSENPTNYGSAATRTITWVANDGSGSNNLSTAQTETVSITAINDAPTLANVATGASYTELGSAAVLASALTVADPDSLNLANATVKITGGTFAGDGDVLTFSTAGTTITASYNAGTETLTLSGSDTLAHYQSVLDSVAFSSTSHNPTNFGSNTTRTVTWQLNDGSGSFNLSGSATTTVSLTAVNDAPTLTGTNASVSFTENGAAVALSPSVTVADQDNQTLVGATVKIVGGTFAGDGDVLAFNTAGTSITASYDSTTETLTLSGSDTFAHYQTVLDSVTFTTPTDNPTDFGSAPTRTLTWVLNDGSGSNNLSAAQTETINVTATNDAPTLSGVPAGVTFATGATITLASLAAVADPDNLALFSATVSITGGTFAGDGDVLDATATGNITVSYNSTTETLTLTGSDTLAHYNTVLESITFASGADPSNANSNPTRTLSWTTNDGFLTSAAQTETITVQNTPAVNPPALAAFTENQASPVTLAPSLVVTDPNATILVGATVALTGGTFAGDGDVLGFNTSGTSITAIYDSSTETLVLSGTDTLAHYQTVLDSVTFTTPSENPTDFGSDPTRIVTWTVNDGSLTNNIGTATSTIDITAINDAPSAVADANASFTEGSSTTVSPGLTVTDVDNLGLVGATVSITGGTFAGDGDVLSADTTGTSITASYNAATETLILSGSDTLAHYQQVLDTVSFASGDNPDDFGSSPSRTVTWTVNDGSGSFNLSTAQTTTIGVTATNDAPTVAAAATDTFVTGQTLTLSPSLSVTDPDNLGLASATVSVAGSFAGDGDVLAADTTGTSITASYDSTLEVLTLTGSDTVAHYQQVLDSVTFASGTDPTGGGTAPTRTITWVANDGTDASAPQTTTVSLQLGPALFVPTVAAFTENGAAVTLAPSGLLTDSNAGAQIASATVSLTGGTFAGDGDVLTFSTTGTSITASYDSTNEILTLSGLDSATHYQQVLDSVAFTTASENPTDFGADPARTVTWTVVDDQLTNSTSTATSTIAITAINDAPTVAAASSVAFTEGATTPISSALSVTDVDSLGLVGATVSITGGSFAGDGDVLSADTTGTTITASYNAATETLILSGSDTLAHYQQVLDSVAFAAGDNPDDFGSSQSRTVTWTVNDGSGSFNLSAAQTTTIGVTAVNDAPTATGQTAHVAYTQSSTVTLSPTLAVADPDNQTLLSATVSVTGGTFAGDGDVLAAAGITSGLVVLGTDTIAVSYASATETLVLSGPASLAAYQTLLDEVTFASGANPNNFGSNTTRTITWVLNDGSGSFNLSAPVTTTVDIADVPPTLSNVAATIAFTQGNTTTLSPAITVTDFDSPNLASATVKITGGTFAGDGDVLSATVAGTSITASYSAATETLTLTGSDTLAHYQQVLDSVKFNSGADPTNHGSNATRTVSWVVNDGNGSVGLSAAQDSTITITPLDAAPTLSTVATNVGFTENGAAVTLSGNLAITDPDSTVITSATVSIAGGAFVGDGDVLAFSTTGTSVTASYDSTTETLLLSGSDTLAHYKQVLDSVTFGTASENPTDYGSDPTRTITWTVADDFNVHSAVATTTVNVTATNDAPILTSVAPTVTYTAGTTLQLSPSASVTDVDSLNIVSATVKVTGGTFAGDGDQLAANVAGTHITASYDAATETLILTGADPLATYQAVLDSITFASGANAGNFGSNLTRTITWVVNDGGGSNNLSATQTTTLDISTINTPPALDNIPATIAFTEGQTLTVAGSAQAIDPDNINLAGATVKVIGGAFAGDGDVFTFSTTGTAITASYNSSTETLILSGSDTVAHYQQVLDNLTFASGDNPDNYGSNTTRVLTWLLDDGNASNNLSTVQTTTISITAVNDPPTIAGTANAAFTENGASVTLSPSVTVTDPDSLAIVGGSVQITGGTFAGDGDVLGVNTAGTAITASYNSTTETLTLTGSDTFAHYAQVLDTVTFVTATDNPDDFGSAPTRTITWALNDGAASSPIGSVTTTVGITVTNDAPTLSSVATSATFTEQAAAVTLSGAASVADPDNQNLVSATVKIVGGTFAGDGDVLSANIAGTAITASYNAPTETLTLTGSDTLAHYQQVLDGLTFNSTSLNPTNYGSNTTRTVTWLLNDGSASSATLTETVTIAAVNNAPTVSSVTGVTGFTENGAAVTASPSLSVADADSLTLTGATVSISNTFAGDGDVLSFSTAGTSITGSYNAATETLVLSGLDTVAHYQSVLDSVTFNSASENPTNYGSNLSRVLTWVVNDGSASSNLSAAQFTTVVVTPINDAPTVSAAAGANVQTGQTIIISPSASVIDPDSLTLASATVAITGGTFAGDGDVLAANISGTAITASYNAATETLTLTGSDTLAHYKQVLDSVTFASTSPNPTNSGANLTRTVSWLVNDGSSSNSLSAAATTTISFQTSVLQDFNGDKQSDLLFLQQIPAIPGTSLNEWQSTGNGFTPNAYTGNVADGWTLTGMGDFNGDLKADLLWQNGGTFTEWQSTGNGFTPNVFVGSVGSGWTLAGVADFSGDGKADLLWQNGSIFTEWQSTGNGFTPNVFIGSVGPGWSLAGVGDFNGDGKNDLLWQNGGTFTEWQSTGNSFTPNVFIGSVGPGWTLAAVGDFSGDTKADLLWQNGGTFTEWQSNGNAFTPNVVIGAVGDGAKVANVGDYNGDHKADLVWKDGSTFSEWQSTGSGFTQNVFVGSLSQGTSIAGNPTTHTHS